MGVLVILVIAVLAAIFIALIASQFRQTERQASVVRLQQIAEAGLRYADDNLVNGPDGADWRPSPNPQTMDYGDVGEFQVTVTYQPESGDPYSNFIRVASLARLRGNPFLQRRLVAYKPILITDYARFVTNAEHNPLPASLGAAVRMYLYETPPDIGPGRLYKMVIDGGVRVNGDLTWHGDVQVNVQSALAQNVAVAGDISHDVQPRWSATSQQWDGADSQVLLSVDGAAQAVRESSDPSFVTRGGYYRDGRPQTDALGYQRWVRHLDPPAIDPARYLALTRDSGTWTDGAWGTAYAGRKVNTGWFGYGKGIYIDNAEHIKYDHDYDQMRTDWAAVTGSYTPDAAVIEFATDNALGPVLRLTWRGGTGQFRGPRGEAHGSSLTLPFPQNGVIYAAGDVAVKGILPATVGTPTGAYDQAAYEFSYNSSTHELTWSPNPDTSRQYHVTVVSGGNIFIDGSLLSPKLPLQGADDPGNTYVALLARDSVVLNTTQIVTAEQPTTEVDPQGVSWYEVRQDRPLNVRVTTPHLPAAGDLRPLALTFRHTGAPDGALGPGDATEMELQASATSPPPATVTYNWILGQWGTPTSTDYTDYIYNMFMEPTPPPALLANQTNAVYPFSEPMRVPLEPGTTGIGAAYTYLLTFAVTADSPRMYWVRDIRARVDVEVDAAAIYAEHGSWYIIPGGFYPEEPYVDANSSGAYDVGEWYADLNGNGVYDAPADTAISIYGAISENRTAPLADEADWIAKWRGSNASWLGTTAGLYDSTLEISGFTLRYLYCPGVRGALQVGTPGSPLRLPKLPVSPMMIAWGERI